MIYEVSNKMKKILFTILLTSFLIFLLHKNKAMAIPTFGTLMPKVGQWQAGLRSDLIFQRDIKDYDNAQTSAYYYKASFGFADWFCLDGLIGLGNVRAELANDKELRYPFNFSGGYGWRAKLYQNEKYGIDWVWGFQHVSTHPKNQWNNGKKYQIIWDEWQFSTVLSKRIFSFIPYCGMKWSFTYLISKVDNERHRRLSNGPPIGLVVGTDLRMNDYIYLNVEGRFFDEAAVNAGFTVRY